MTGCAKPGCDYEKDERVHRPMSECPDLGTTVGGNRSKNPDRCPWPYQHHGWATGKPFIVPASHPTIT